MNNKNQNYKQLRKEEAIRVARQKNMQRLVLWTIVVIVIAAGIALITKKHEAGPKTPAIDFAYDKHPMLGQASAPVTIAEFGDYKCPSCKYFNDSFMPQLKKDYIETGKAKLFFINDPFIGLDSITAALAAESVYHQNPSVFWKYHEAIYRVQGDEKTSWATPDFLVNLAKQENISIDLNKLRQDIDKKTYNSDVSEDMSITKQANVQATPAIFVNGQEVANSMDYASVKQAIEAALGGK